MCAAAALAITVTVCGVTALAPTASASPSSCEGYIRLRYPNMDGTVITGACGFVSVAQQTAPHDLRSWGVAAAACAGLLKVNGASPGDAAVACLLSALPAPFYQEEWCATTGGTACLNAWSGGPWVNDSTTGFESGDNHQNFVLSAVDNASGNPTGNYQLVFAGANDSWAGQCIGDANNNSGYADTSLDGCGNGTGGGSGWGTNFTVGTSGCPSGEMWFHNNHWNGYLGPGGSANGSHFYLNKPTPYCFNIDFF